MCCGSSFQIEVIIFSRGKVRNLPAWYIGDNRLEVVFDFMYLGLKLNYNNNFFVTQKDLYARATRAMFMLLKRSYRLMLPLDVIIDLFDKMVLPVITYGSEVWGISVMELTRRLQRKFYKIVFHLRQSTPTTFLLGETGKAPVDVYIKCRVLNYWLRLSQPENKDKIECIVYKFIYKMYIYNRYESPYIAFVKKTLQEIGMNDAWLNQENISLSPVWFKEKVKRCLLDNYIQSWYSTIDQESMYINYRMFKPAFGQERYISLLPTNLAIKLARFRTTNNMLPVNKLRFENVPRNERICQKCEMNEIGDEFHYLFCCPFFDIKRRACIPGFYRIRPNKIHSLYTDQRKFRP